MMNIGWFTPLSVKSAIARFSVAVAAELSQLARVDLCHFDRGPIHKTDVPVVKFRSAEAVSAQALKQYDITIYNFGNYLPYHGDIYTLSRRCPGISILHDFVMHHFFAAYYLERAQDPDAYALLMEAQYGEEGRAWRGARVWESDEVVRFPLFEEAARGARGVVTHSEFFKKRVDAEYVGPVRRIPLAYGALDTGPAAQTGTELGIADDAVLIVTLGHVNANKRIEDVLHALARIVPAEKRIVYAIIGACPSAYRIHLESLAEANGLGECVQFLGHVPDRTLKSYLARADICVNLRLPSFEGASASVIEEMLAAKPVIVNNTGFFGELPGNCVAKIALGRDGELASKLEWLIKAPEARTEMGTRAREFASREFRADRYAKEILDFAWEVRTSLPLLNVADRVGGELARMGLTDRAKTVDTVANQLHDLFCASRISPPLWRA
jgi:glycosyltransferase involved in cell wall biosynthesis